MLSHQDLLDIGLSPDAATLQARMVAAANALGFGLTGGALIRGRLQSRKASVHSFGNQPEQFVEASRSLDISIADPLMQAMQARPGCFVYDQAFYALAGAGELWELQAPFGYRHGMAISIHEPSHAETFCFGFDGLDAIPGDQRHRLRLEGAIRLIGLHAHSASRRLHTPAATVDLNALSADEVEALRWAADGQSVWLNGEQTVYTNRGQAVASATSKLGASTSTQAVLRAIEGGLIDR